ncbi:MAG: phosphoribosylglycinamide formyltransferase [Muribaculaceae bacterium]|nr:phosphoribosylglycinamide formyltransferase [Muribaculaceae bacterium]MDE6382244.1 phosphoribosylglycinamide formyltransferase [Muribaculaceae bacterium]
MKENPQIARIAVFASGNGSNAENIIRYFNDPSSVNGGSAEVVLVVCNRPEAPVLARAAALGVPTETITRSLLNDETRFMELMEKHGIDFIALAGFLLMIPPFLISRFSGRIVNIHPSLLPRYGGKGMYGRHIHEAVVKAGERETGITVHHVSENCDEGAIIFQARVDLDTSDTPEDVERKIHALESFHYPKIISTLVGGL